MSVLVIGGGQYGSEGKGVIAHHFAPAANVAIRVGGPNAGHSIIHEGQVWKMRSVPVAWTNPECTLILGPGAVIDPVVLDQEVRDLEKAGYKVRDRLWIDKRATILSERDPVSEANGWSESGRNLTSAIGSTGKGIGAARVRRLQRLDSQWQPAALLGQNGYQVTDTTRIYRVLAETPPGPGFPLVLVEGTQGFGLSLTYGPWPYVTSQDCTTAQLLNDAGLTVGSWVQSLLVFRSYPIRVAGNSGPLKGELTWETMAQILGHDIEPERTTVTNKIRRIGEFDWDLALEAVRINRPDALALTFADYIDPACAGVRRWDSLTSPVRHFIADMENRLNVPVSLVGTGGPGWAVVDPTR